MTDQPDETTPPVQPVPPIPPDEPEPSPYLTRSTMLPVEGVVYCHEHTAVHDDTTDPLETGEKCSEKEHRAVYYRAHKGDYDERTDEQKQVARTVLAASGEGLSDDERALLLRMAGEWQDAAQGALDTLRQIFGTQDPDVGEVIKSLTLLNSIHDKLTTTMLDEATKDD